MIEFVDKTSELSGTPLNRANMMALQGFVANTTVFQQDGSIVETNRDGHTKTTEMKADGRIIETFVGDFTIQKTTLFHQDGSIEEEIS